MTNSVPAENTIAAKLKFVQVVVMSHGGGKGLNYPAVRFAGVPEWFGVVIFMREDERL